MNCSEGCACSNWYQSPKSGMCSSAFCTSSHSLAFCSCCQPFSKDGPARLLPEARLVYRKYAQLVLMLEVSGQSCIVVRRGCESPKGRAIWPGQKGLFPDCGFAVWEQSACLLPLAFVRSEKWEIRGQPVCLQTWSDTSQFNIILS